MSDPSGPSSASAHPPLPPGRESVADLVAALSAWIGRIWPDPERGTAVARHLEQRFGRDGSPVEAAALAEIEGAAHAWSRHLALELHDGPAAPDEEPPGWPPQDPVEVARRAAWVGSVVRRPDGVAVLAVDNLDPVDLAASYLEAAFVLARGARGVVLDLRANGGGDPATVARVLDWVVGPRPARIGEVRSRGGVRQWWTAGRPAADALAPGTGVAVATSGRTFSSGEALAYHLQALCGALVVGAATRGAADHVTPVRVTPHVTAYLPEAYAVDATTGANWEGTGVRPDVPCEPAEAVEVAARRLIAGTAADG